MITRLATAGCLALLLALPAVAQDANTDRPANTGSVTELNDVADQDLPVMRQLVSDENAHRDRLARIRRLRQLAAETGNTARLRALDDLERRELTRHEARRLRDRARLSERGRVGADDFVRRGGMLRARTAAQAQQQERMQAKRIQDAREQQARPQPTRRPAPRAPARPSRPNSGGSPR